MNHVKCQGLTPQTGTSLRSRADPGGCAHRRNRQAPDPSVATRNVRGPRGPGPGQSLGDAVTTIYITPTQAEIVKSKSARFLPSSTYQKDFGQFPFLRI